MRTFSRILHGCRRVGIAGLCCSVVLLTVVRCYAEPGSPASAPGPTAPAPVPLSLQKLSGLIAGRTTYDVDRLLYELHPSNTLMKMVATTPMCAEANRIGGDPGALRHVCKGALINRPGWATGPDWDTEYGRLDSKVVDALKAATNKYDVLFTFRYNGSVLNFIDSCVEENKFCLNSNPNQQPRNGRRGPNPWETTGVNLLDLVALQGQPELMLKHLAESGSVSYHEENISKIYELLDRLNIYELLEYPDPRVSESAQRIIIAVMNYDNNVKNELGAYVEKRAAAALTQQKNEGSKSGPVLHPLCDELKRRGLLASLMATAQGKIAAQEMWLLDIWMNDLFCKLGKAPLPRELFRNMCTNPALLTLTAFAMSVHASPPDPRSGAIEYWNSLIKILDQYEQEGREGRNVALSALKGGGQTVVATLGSLLQTTLYPVGLIDSTITGAMELQRECIFRLIYGERSYDDYAIQRDSNRIAIDRAETIAKWAASLALASPTQAGKAAKLLVRLPGISTTTANVIASASKTLLMQTFGCVGAYLNRDEQGSEQQQYKQSTSPAAYMENCLQRSIGTNAAVRVYIGGLPSAMQSSTDITDNILDIYDTAAVSGKDSLKELVKVYHGQRAEGQPFVALLFQSTAIVMDLQDDVDSNIQ